MIDSLIKFKKYFNASSILSSYHLNPKEYILVTMHRPSNVDYPEKFYSFLNALNEISDKYPVIWPVHPRVRNTLKKINFNLSKSIKTIEPASYFEFMGLQKNARMVITDSGGVQEESTYFRVPCFTVRENTERPITISNGTNKLVGTDFSKLFDNIFNDKSISDIQKDMPKLWDGLSSKKNHEYRINFYFIIFYEQENKNIPFSGPDIIDLDLQNVESVIKSGWLTHGKFTEELEELFCSYTGAKYATTVSNCTAALHLSCIAAEFGFQTMK